MSTTQFQKGDRVKFRLGTRMVRGTIKEDRGPIGIKGRRLYLVEFPAEPPAPAQIELPAEEMQVVNGTASVK